MGIFYFFSLRIKVQWYGREEHCYVISLSRDSQMHLDCDMIRDKYFPEKKRHCNCCRPHAIRDAFHLWLGT
jgi:hypothetical protein